MFARLPKQVQKQTRNAYRKFRKNPYYPSLRLKKIHPNLPIYSVRINKDYRVVGQLSENNIIWFWVGSHAEYNMLL